jgi:hypothetical protein
MEYFNPTPTELRQMAHLQAVILGLGDETPFEILHTRQETDAEEKEFETRLKACLGEDRFTEYRRAQDPAYQEAVDFTKQNDLPAGTAAKVYQIKQVADAGRDGLEEDQSLAGLEKERQLRQIQETTSQAIEGLLGSKAFGEYLKQGRGSWVTNYVKAQRSKSQISESRLQ